MRTPPSGRRERRLRPVPTASAPGRPLSRIADGSPTLVGPAGVAPTGIRALGSHADRAVAQLFGRRRGNSQLNRRKRCPVSFGLSPNTWLCGNGARWARRVADTPRAPAYQVTSAALAAPSARTSTRWQLHVFVHPLCCIFSKSPRVFLMTPQSLLPAMKHEGTWWFGRRRFAVQL